MWHMSYSRSVPTRLESATQTPFRDPQIPFLPASPDGNQVRKSLKAAGNRQSGN